MGSAGIQAIEANFAAQFEEENEGILFRRDRKGPAIRVTAAERDAAIQEYANSLKWGYRVVMAVVVAILLAGVAITVLTGQALSMMLWSALLPVAAAYPMWLFHAGRRAVARFSHRTPVRRERDRGEMRRIMRAETSWGSIAVGTIALATLFLTRRALWKDPLHGEGLLWSLGLAFALVGISVVVFQKWSYEREG